MVYTRFLFLVLLAVCYQPSSAQVKKKRYIERSLDLSLVAGVSTNGMHGGWYINKYSFSLLSSLSAANRYFQFSGISSLNLQYATGIQIAGIANVVGSNTFINMTIGEEREQIREGFKSNMTGIQFAGLINLIRDEMSGWQTTGGINFVHKDAKALQIAGISNMVGGHMTGFQISGLYNVALKSSNGIQIAGLSNLTNGNMQGIQLAMLNKAWTIRGPHSSPPSKATGWQIGLVNLASEMHGLQLGVINRTKKFRGVQIGLINFYSTAPNRQHGSNGIPIALLNFGNRGNHKRFYTTETFLYNFEYTTGNCHNCTFTKSSMPLDGKSKITNQNALILSYNDRAFTFENHPLWSFGYGFERVHYNKENMVAADPRNERKFFSYGIKFQHLNFSERVRPELNLLSKINFSYGRIFRNPVFTCYLFASITGNSYWSNDHSTFTEENNERPLALVSDRVQFWPGYELGIHIY